MTNILVVDDLVDAAETLAMVFEAVGHETHVAFNGAEGLSEAKKYMPHIIFLDLDMPVLNGYEAATAIREAPDTDDPFIVALTAKGGAEVQRKTKAAGFDFYVQKPADTRKLIALVEDLEGRERPPD